MLEWSDVLKLFIPFLLSILFFLIKDWLSKFNEKRAKQESLWRLLKIEIRRLSDDIDGLNIVVKAYDEGMYAGFTHNLDESLKRIVQRLSELEPRKTYIYAKYESSHGYVENNINSLYHIIHSLITISNIKEDRAKNAIKSQVFVLVESLIEMAEASYEIMESIKRSNPRCATYDEQVLHELKEMLNKAKEKFKKSTELTAGAAAG